MHAAPMHSTPRRLAALLIATATGLLATLALAAPASATAYRFWSYWQGASGEWEVAMTGPSEHEVVDQDVQGWRFGISTAEVTQKPDNAPDFATLCPEAAAGEAPDGQLRVAVVVDAGFVADAPEGQTPPADTISCVTVPEGSTGSQALAAATTVDEQDGLICAVNDFPTDECGAEVSDADAEAAAEAAESESPNPAVPAGPDDTEAAQTSDDSGSPLPFIIGAGAVAVLLAATVAITVRRRNGPDAGAAR